MKDLPHIEGINLAPELDSDQSSSIFNSENERPLSDSLESIPSPPIDNRLRLSLSQQLQRRESAMRNEGEVQWSLARAEQASVAQMFIDAPTNNPNLRYDDDGAVNKLRRKFLLNERIFCSSALEKRL